MTNTPPPAFTGTATGRVYDRGYRPFEGTLGGRQASVMALWRASVRRALGLRRSWRQKVFPWLLLAIVTVPAIVNVGVGYITRDTPAEGFEFITYRDYVGVSNALLVFIALVAPDVICPDRRHRTLPLIFARPLTGTDYVVAKIGAIVSIVFAFGLIPQIILYVGQMLVSDAALDYVGDNTDVLWQVPISVAVLSVYFSVLALAIAAFTTRRLIAGAGFLLTLLISAAAAGIISESTVSGRSLIGALDLLTLPLQLRDLVFLGEVSPDSYLAGLSGGVWAALGVYLVVVVGSVLVLWRRYAYVEA